MCVCVFTFYLLMPLLLRFFFFLFITGTAVIRQHRYIGHHIHYLCIHQVRFNLVSMKFEWQFAISLKSFSFTLLFVSCFFSAAFFFSLSLSFFIHRFNHTPVIMASGRELCYVLLTGVCLCYVMTFIILARPTVIRCACMRVGLGLCLSLCYSAIFVKTNRISRIFNCGVKAVSRPIYTSPISQIAICLCT